MAQQQHSSVPALCVVYECAAPHVQACLASKEQSSDGKIDWACLVVEAFNNKFSARTKESLRNA